MADPAPGAAEHLIEKLAARSWTLALAESCTAGLVADLLASVSGASRSLWGSFVCYTPGAKIAMLGVAAELIDRHGAVSRETACAMAEGALRRSGADMAAAVTGLAGPGGDGSGVPVGTVWIAVALREGETEASRFFYQGFRNSIRRAAAADVLREILKKL